MSANTLFDYLMKKHRIRTDVKLSELIGVIPPTISQMRNGRRTAGNSLIIHLHEKMGMSIAELKALIAQEDS